MKKSLFKKPTLEEVKAKRKLKLSELFEGKQSSLYKTWKASVEPKTRPKLKLPKKKVVSISKLKKDLWAVVSPFIRNRDNFRCITCGKTGTGGQIHAGHFLPSGNCGALLRYHPKNIHAQCYFENINLGGNGAVYYTKMVERYGQKYVNKLFQIKNQTTIKADEYFYQSLIDLYKQGNEEEIIKFLESYL